MSVPSGSSTLAHVYCLWASSAIYCMWLRLLSAASAAFRSLPRRILRGEAQPFHIITPFEGTSPYIPCPHSVLTNGTAWIDPLSFHLSGNCVLPNRRKRLIICGNSEYRNRCSFIGPRGGNLEGEVHRIGAVLVHQRVHRFRRD